MGTGGGRGKEGGGGVEGVPRLYVMSSQRVASQKSVSRTVVVITKSVDIGRCQTSPLSVPPLSIWYRPKGGGGKGGGGGGVCRSKS